MPRLALALPALPALPSQCEVCRRWGGAGAALCDLCIGRFAVPRPRCGRCALPLGQAAAECGACLRDPPPFVRSVCAVDYAFPWDRLIAAFKFQGRPELASPLAARLGVAALAAPSPRPDLLLPVPLTPARLAERGYNQAWELARRVAPALGLAAHPAWMQRHGAGAAHQVGLSRAERQRNLQGSFMVDPRQRGGLRGRRVALVDDVMTTGATAREAAAVLLRAGAAAVEIWVLARTPES